MIPQNALVSVEEVISRIKADLRLVDSTEHDTYLEILLREGLGSLNCINQLEKKQCRATVEDGKVKLENDLVKFIALRPKTWLEAEDQTILNCSRLIYADTAFLRECGYNCSGLTSYRSGFQINKGYISFNSDTPITEVEYAYQGMWLDEDGKPAIFERFERALTAYACYKFTRTWMEKYNQFVMMDYKNEWINQREKLKGMAVKDEFEQNKVYIGGLMRSLIVSSTTLID